MKFNQIIHSLLETDLYKFSMGQAIFHQASEYETTWTFKCRNKDVQFTPAMVAEIREQLKAYCTLRFTEEELQALRENVQTLQRFKGLPSFSWMDSLVNKLEDKLSVRTSVDNILAYEENAGYTGIDWLKDCFDAIVNKQPVRIDYRNFEEKKFKWTIHPYYIKEYNNRWFLIGLNPEYARLTHIPLDRIDEIEPIHIDYIPNTTTDFEKYFDNVIGTTVVDAPVQDIKLRFSPKRLQYVLTKPLHKSQKCSDADAGVVSLRLIPNRELESLILSFGADVEVIEPQSLRLTIQEKVKQSFEHYFNVQTGCTE